MQQGTRLLAAVQKKKSAVLETIGIYMDSPKGN